jgi:hypothetical protein
MGAEMIKIKMLVDLWNFYFFSPPVESDLGVSYGIKWF